MASGLAGTTRFSGLLAGVAGLGAVLVAMATADFQRAAAQWPLAPALARDVAKRFSAGDVAGRCTHCRRFPPMRPPLLQLRCDMHSAPDSPPPRGPPPAWPWPRWC